MTTLPPGLTQISEDEAMRLLASKTPGLVALYIGHDDWCLTLKTGQPSLCNCNPTREYFRVSPPKKGAKR